jgi:hypothetical protein
MASRQLWLHRTCFTLTKYILLLSSFLFGLPDIAEAQRIPVADDTLGTERSQVSPFNPTIDLIGGGARRGANLFQVVIWK